MKLFVCIVLVIVSVTAAPSETRDKRGIFGETLLAPHLHHDIHHGLHHDFHHDFHHGLHYDPVHFHGPLDYAHGPIVHSYHSPLISHAHVHAPLIDHHHLHAPLIHDLHHAPLLPSTTIIKSAKVIHGSPLHIKHVKHASLW